MQSKSNVQIFALLLGIWLIAFFYRVYGIFDNTPFWIDEFSTGVHATQILKHGLSIFTDPTINLEIHNITTHFLVAGFFTVFGQKEWVARLPFVIIGSFIPLLVFLVARKVYNLQTAISAMILTTFSYFTITWSRQARGYVLIQFLILLATYLYFKLLEKSEKSLLYQILFVVIILLGVLTHAFFLVFIMATFFHVVFFQREKIKGVFKWPFTYVVLGFALAFKIGLVSQLITDFILSNPIKANNLWYYHSFLWREYGLVTFLAIMGFIISVSHKSKQIGLVIIYTLLHLVFIFYFFGPYVSRYLLPIFPFLLIGMSYAIVQLVNRIVLPVRYDLLKIILPILIVLFIVGNGDTFVSKPKRFYSVNHDFREIALIDYHQVYNLIKNKGDLEKGKTAVVDTWTDRLYWYVVRDFEHAYIFRWQEEKGLVNGLKRRTTFEYNAEGEKIIPRQKNLKFIGELSDLKMAMKKYPKGFIFIDDTSMPKEVIEYAQQNFKKELYLDHYPLDDNPYSIWPATLYSWGI